MIIPALIASKNNPNVKTVTGIVRTTRIGLRIEFSTARTNATIMAVEKSAR